jgi:L-2-hydroxyglutarate oxidase LhgO
MYDVLIVGGGVSGVSCALVIGSALKKPYAIGKKVGLFTHQKASSLPNAVYNNAYGIPAGTLGADLMESSLAQLQDLYPEVEQLPAEKLMKVEGEAGNFTVTTNKDTYQAKIVVIGIGSANSFDIEGLMEYVIPNKKAIPEKNRIQLTNDDHLVKEGIYVVGTLAGHRSQLPIAAGSGAAVATDILTLWNDGKVSQSHDNVPK